MRRPYYRPQSHQEFLEPRSLLAIASLAPVAADDAYATSVDQNLVGNAIAGLPVGGADSAAKSGMPLKIVEVNGSAVTNGAPLTLASGATLAVHGEGSFSYDPLPSSIPAGQSEHDSFRYTLAPAFSQVFMFGDSLSDQGRLFALTNQQFPRDPPHFQGRRSNGHVWIEDLAPRLGLSVTLANNYSVSGATTGIANSNESSLGTDLPGLRDELNQFLGDLNGAPADSNALYIVWAGANDFFLPLGSPTAFVAQAMTNLTTVLTSLHTAGARHVLVMNLPDIGITPFGRTSGQSGQLTSLSSVFNTALEDAIAGLDFDVALVDNFRGLRQIVADPAAFGFTNVTSSCLNGTTVVGNPDEFLFWDNVHPTAAGHRVIAQMVFAALTDEGVVSISVENESTPPQLFIENLPGPLPGELHLRLSANDASPADQAATFTFTVDWGDGTPLQSIHGPSQGTLATHSYPLGTVQRVAVFATDQRGAASQTFHEAVILGTEKHERIEAFSYRQDQFRVRLGNRIAAQLRESEVDRLVVFGLGGNDWISAASLSIPVELDGGAGIDSLYGGQRGDILRGGAGNDVIIGGSGDDVLEGQGGNDYLAGGQGNEAYRFGAGALGSDTLHENYSQGTDTLDFSQFSIGINLILSQALAIQNPKLRILLTISENFEHVTGTVFHDTIVGNSANNSLRGGFGDDRLSGGGGDDDLHGEAGDDRLSGDAVDLLFGGAGLDLFDGLVENGSSLNPKPKKYKDWGTL